MNTIEHYRNSAKNVALRALANIPNIRSAVNSIEIQLRRAADQGGSQVDTESLATAVAELDRNTHNLQLWQTKLSTAEFVIESISGPCATPRVVDIPAGRPVNARIPQDN